MAQLIPTPVTLEELIDATSDINTINNGGTQEAQPRTRAYDVIIVEVTDDPWVNGSAHWVQKQTTSEWVRGNSKLGNATLASYTLPVDTRTMTVDWTIVPEVLA